MADSSGESGRTGEAATIRRASADEWQDLRRLRLRALELDPLAFGSTLDREGSMEDAQWQERATRGAESSVASQWVAEDASGQLIGSAVLAEVEGSVHVFGMWVEPEHRGRGIGAGLLDAGLAWARAAFPGRAVRLEVNPRQLAAVKLYESRGFRYTGTRRPLGHAAGETVLEMQLPAGSTSSPR